MEYVITKNGGAVVLRCWCCHESIPLSADQIAGRAEIDCPNPGCGYRETADLSGHVPASKKKED